MIVRERPGFLPLFFIVRGSIVLRILPQVFVIALLSAATVFARETWPTKVLAFDGAPFSLVGIALSVFLGFRNSACYDRWWEGRKRWGELIVLCRTLARQTLLLSYRNMGSNHRARLLAYAIAFAKALVEHLRPSQNRGRVGSESDPVPDLSPDEILTSMTAEIVELRRGGVITDIELQMFDDTIQEMAAVQAACERLKNTPLPFGYTLLLHRTAYAFCLLLPFGFADTLGWGTPLVTALIAYTFFGLDALGDELEDPFGDHPNTLPIKALATAIEIELKISAGEENVPHPAVPIDFVLM